MRTSLSASADPNSRVVDLLDVCRRRDLQGIELVSDSECDLLRAVELADLGELARLMAEHDCPVTGLYVRDLSEICSLSLAQLSARTAAPVVAPAGVVPTELVADLDALYAAARGRLLISHATGSTQASALLEAMRTLRPERIGLAWEVRPALESLRTLRMALECLGGRLEYVRWFGGGPERSSMNALELEPLFVELASIGYSGPLVVCPSDRSQRPLWRKWMEPLEPAGCGTVVQ